MASTATEALLLAGDPGDHAAPRQGGAALHPRHIQRHVKPVMANMIHSVAGQGPCRWGPSSLAIEKANAERQFAHWVKQLKTQGLGRPEDVRLREPVHFTSSENGALTLDQVTNESVRWAESGN